MEDTKTTQRIFEVPIWIHCAPLPTLGRIPLRGSQLSTALSEGENKRVARLNLTNSPFFYKNCSSLPEKIMKRFRPFRLRRKGKIEEILECEKRHKNMRGEYTCGVPVHAMDSEEREEYSDQMAGEFGICCIEGYSVFDSPNCPYN